MPTYYSARKGQSLELRPGGYGEVEDAVIGKMRVPVKPMVVRFRPLDPPFKVFGLPSKDGVAQGVLLPEDAALQIRRRSTEFGPAADNLPKTDEELTEWVIQKLRANPLYGRKFVEIRDADEILDGDAVDDHLAPPPGMVTSPVGVIVKSRGETGKVRAYCQACDRVVDPRGINGHSRSKVHRANLRKHEEKMKVSGESQER